MTFDIALPVRPVRSSSEPCAILAQRRPIGIRPAEHLGETLMKITSNIQGIALYEKVLLGSQLSEALENQRRPRLS
jgi:hypothetical protein